MLVRVLSEAFEVGQCAAKMVDIFGFKMHDEQHAVKFALSVIELTGFATSYPNSVPFETMLKYMEAKDRHGLPTEEDKKIALQMMDGFVSK